ncbi:MAG: dTMP kinase [Gemmatimonadales bacterium]
MSAPGCFIVVEGPEGAGKSTLVAALAGRMRQDGVEPVVVREPGGTAAAEVLRRELLDPARRWEPAAELLYFATARADLLHHVVRPALGAGRVVLSDRFDLSTEAYQIGGRGLDAATVRLVNRAATGGLRPALTLVLDVTAGVGPARQRAAGKNPDRLEREGEAFHQRVRDFYLAHEGPGIRHLDASLQAERVLQAAWNEVCRECPGPFGAHRG